MEKLNKYKGITSGLSKGFAGLSMANDAALYLTNQQSGARTTFHIGATGVAVGIGYAVSAPASLAATSVFLTGEKYYDAIQSDRAYNLKAKNSQVSF